MKIIFVDKLVPDLGNESKYVVHYKNLELYVSLGMTLTEAHRILKFKQSDWLKKYIDFNRDKIKNAANSFEEDFFKLMNNSVFGKTMENLRKRFVAIHLIKPVLTLNKPVYVGFSSLDLSKLLMCEFHYKYIGSKFDANLLFTDTDSLAYEIKTEDVYEDFYEDQNLFDFSDYPLNSKLFDPGNKNVIGKMKDEFKGKKY